MGHPKDAHILSASSQPSNPTSIKDHVRIAVLSAFKGEHGRDPSPDELDELLPPVNCRRTRDRRVAHKHRGNHDPYLL